MVRNHPDSCSPLAIPGASSSHCPSMEGSASEARAVGASSSSQDSSHRTQPAVQASQPRKKKPDDFRFGKILGEGSFSTVRILLFSHTWVKLMLHVNIILVNVLGWVILSSFEVNWRSRSKEILYSLTCDISKKPCNVISLFCFLSSGCPGERAGNRERICK